MTVLEDYEAETKDFGLLKAGVTLDPSKPEDKQKLDAALNPSSTVKFFRIKNSWGAVRDDRASAPGFPGYHDLYMDYLNGPIPWCPDATSPTTVNLNSTGRVGNIDVIENILCSGIGIDVNSRPVSRRWGAIVTREGNGIRARSIRNQFSIRIKAPRRD